MRKIRLLLGMLALFGVQALVILCASPYAPVVAPVPQDYEQIWEIEDAREMSGEPLVTALSLNGVPMAYDAQENTFYGTLGLGGGESWPQMRLTAPDAKGVRLLFVDDYTYDWRSDALREGYAYQVMAYTDTQYAYFNVVFTGLMQVCLQAEEALGAEDTPVAVSINTAEGVLESCGRAHYRGGVTIKFEKRPYKVEFTRTSDGREKTVCAVPQMGQMDQFILVPMWYDNDMLRDRLSWTLYGEIAGEDVPYGARRSAYVELYLNDRYEGVYLMLEPFDHEAETAGQSGAVSIYRTCPFYEAEEKPITPGAFGDRYGYELHYPRESGDPFAAIEDYIEIASEADDEVFVRRVFEQIDIDSMISYHLMLQAFGLGDNVFNNMYIWAQHGENGYTYRYYPWDMDMSWGEDDHIEWILEDYDGWMYFPVMDRMLGLNPQNLRERWAKAWRALRAGVLSDENVTATIRRLSEELNNSGAILRNSARWNKNTPQSETFEVLNYVQMRFALLDETVEYIASAPGGVPMLMYDDPLAESGVIYGFDGRENSAAQK